MSETFWLTGLSFPNGKTGDLLVADGKIAAIGAAAGEAPRHDRRGWLCLPALVEAHVHLDKTFLGAPWQPHLVGGSVAERIRQEKVAQATLSVPIETRGGTLVEIELGHGTGFMRTHVDIDADVGLSHFDAVMAIRENYADRLDIQIVAFPQSGILSSPGTEALLDQALGNGADLIGGLDPAGIDGDPVAHLDVVFKLAEKHGKDVDIHLHEGGPLGLFELSLICDHAERLGLAGRVTVSHAYCLGQVGLEEIGRIGDRLAGAGVAILTAVPPVSMPPLRALAARGVNVVAASDNIRDAWAPFGNGDVLDRASMAAFQQTLDTDDDLGFAFDLISANAARLMRLDGYGLAVGNSADFVLVEAQSVAEAVAAPPVRRVTYKRGRRIAELPAPRN
jgi:cytosine/adenosine deaminase-related metal-dependent hydrolase